jgi:hypothetical protein
VGTAKAVSAPAAKADRMYLRSAVRRGKVLVVSVGRMLKILLGEGREVEVEAVVG